MSLILSASSIASYLNCHYEYLLNSVYRVPGGQSLPAALGNAVHKGVETFWKGTKAPADALEAEFAKQLKQVPTPYDEPPTGVLVDGHRMLDTYIEVVAPTFTPTLVEKSFLINVDGVTLSGTIDAADDDVHDLKTTTMISKFHPESYSLQLTLYSLGYRFLTGRKPGRLLLDVLTRRGKVPYRQYEIEPQVGELRDIIALTAAGIMAEDYEPTGATANKCKFCPYQRVCQYARVD